MTNLNNEIRTVESLSSFNAMSFGSWNARSLWNKFDEFDRILQDSNLDACLVCKSWFNDTHLDSELNIVNYNFQRSDRDHTTCKASGGGGWFCT